MIAPRFAQFVARISGQDGFAQEIEHQRVERLEAVLIAQIISQQNILLEKQNIVLAPFDESEAIVQNFVGRRASSPNSAFRDLRQADSLRYP